MPMTQTSTHIPEVRQNRLTGQWVVYSPARHKRPRDFKRKSKKEAAPEQSADCPFCPGNEDKLDTVLLERSLEGDSRWQTRVIVNKYPALTPIGSPIRRTSEGHIVMDGIGFHDVIIEHPGHDRQPAQWSSREMDAVVATYHGWYEERMRHDSALLGILFRNHGPRAGTSLVHPHAQFIATNVVPLHVRQREQAAQHHFDSWGRCLMCELLESERSSGGRIVYENDDFLAFVPFAAEVPYEVWIVPVRHRADFGNISDLEKAGLSKAMQAILSRLFQVLDDPDYNLVVNSSARFRAGEPHLHWFVQIRPRLTTRAGFEIGSGMSINPSLPEDDAAALMKK